MTYKLHGNTSVWLDAIRAMAAQAVVLGHTYQIFFSGETVHPEGAIDRICRLVISAIGSFSHPAVIVFFILSGYLVGGSALNDIRMGIFKIHRYLLSRGIRLLVVLLPALVLTAVLDWSSFN